MKNTIIISLMSLVTLCTLAVWVIWAVTLFNIALPYDVPHFIPGLIIISVWVLNRRALEIYSIRWFWMIVFGVALDVLSPVLSIPWLIVVSVLVLNRRPLWMSIISFGFALGALAQTLDSKVSRPGLIPLPEIFYSAELLFLVSAISSFGFMFWAWFGSHFFFPDKPEEEEPKRR